MLQGMDRFFWRWPRCLQGPLLVEATGLGGTDSGLRIVPQALASDALTSPIRVLCVPNRRIACLPCGYIFQNKKVNSELVS